MVYLSYKFAIEAFAHKVDKDGNPYLLHIFRVAENFRHDDILLSIAVLRDILEDCKEWNAARLSEYFPDRVVTAIVALTKNDGEDYDQYLQRVAENDDARAVKIAALKDNMSLARFWRDLEQKDLERLIKYHYHLEQEDLERLIKYHKAYSYLLSF